MEPEPIDQFERELRQAFERRPAPPGLKRRILDARARRQTLRHQHRMVLWQRLAAAIVLAAVVGTGFAWRQHQQVRKGEEARREVRTALRVTQRALDKINARLSARNHTDQDQGDHE
ncbi:MAG TPA: hypothetical protein VF392_04530 [Terracidiphilus sp.]